MNTDSEPHKTFGTSNRTLLILAIVLMGAVLSIGSITTLGDTITAQFFKGDGGQLTNVSASNETYSYIIWTDGNTIHARNGTTGYIDFSGLNGTAARVAINSSFNNGTRFLILPGAYYLGQSSSNDAVFKILNTQNGFYVDGYGATFITNTTDQSQTSVFYTIDPNDITVKGLGFYDIGNDLTVDWRGSWAYYFSSSTNTGNSGNIHIEDNHADNILGLLNVNAGSGNSGINHRIKGITLINNALNNSYYGLSFQNNGDDVRVINFKTSDVFRSYFPYGITDHNIDLSINDITDMTYKSDASVLIKRYNRNTTSIKLNAVYRGVAGHRNAVVLEQENDDGAASLISDIDINMILDNLSSPLTMNPIILTRSLTASSTEVTTTTNQHWDNIKLSGSFGNYPLTTTGIKYNVTQNNIGTLQIDPQLYSWSGRFSPVFRGFKLKTDSWDEIYTGNGSVTGTTHTVDLSQFDSAPFVLGVDVFAMNDSTQLLLMNSTVSKYTVFGYNAGGGSVAILKTNNTYLDSSSIYPPVITTFTPSGENLIIGFQANGVSGYNNVNGYTRVDVQYLSGLKN